MQKCPSSSAASPSPSVNPPFAPKNRCKKSLLANYSAVTLSHAPPSTPAAIKNWGKRSKISNSLNLNARFNQHSYVSINASASKPLFADGKSLSIVAWISWLSKIILYFHPCAENHILLLLMIRILWWNLLKMSAKIALMNFLLVIVRQKLN